MGCVCAVLCFRLRGSATQDRQPLLTVRRGPRLLFSGQSFVQRERMLRPLRDFACNGASCTRSRNGYPYAILYRTVLSAHLGRQAG